MRRIFGLVLALVAGAAPFAAAAEPGRSGPPAIDVIVVDSRGRAVDTLSAADFSVTEQSRPLAVDSVRFVRSPARSIDAAAGPASASDSPAGAGSLIAIYLDEFHVTPGPIAERMRAALIQLISQDVGPADQLIVLKSLDSLLDIRPSLNREDAIRKVQAFDPRRGEYEPRTPFERNFIAGTPAQVEVLRAQIATSSLEALATELGRLGAARKTLIVFSDGFVRNGRRRADDLLPNLDSIVLAANRGRVAIYPFAPMDAQLPASAASTSDQADFAKWRESLRSLADATSGRMISSVGGAPEGDLSRAFSDSRGYYEITLSRDLARDGRFHAVDVVVRGQGLTSRARRGYWAPSDGVPARRTSVLGISPLPVTATMVRRTSALIRPWFGISKGADGETEVSFVWEPAPRVPGERNPSPEPARVGLTVMTVDGTPVFQGTVLPSTIAVSDLEAAAQSTVAFASPPGRLVVRMSIEDATSRVVDQDVRDLEVKGFPGPVSMGSPQVLRAQNAREYQALIADPDAAPIANRQFSRTERLIVRVPVFTAAGVPTVSARLISGFGTTMRELTVMPTRSRPNDYQVDVPLASLAKGSYVVELTARTTSGEVRERLPIRVTP